MKCEDFKRLASSEADKDLNVHQKKLLDEHCTACSSCYAFRSALTALGNVLGGAAREPIPYNPHHTDISLRAILRQNAKIRKIVSLPTRIFLSAAASLALVCAGMIIQNMLQVQGPGSKVQGPRSKVQGPGSRVQGSGFRVRIEHSLSQQDSLLAAGADFAVMALWGSDAELVRNSSRTLICRLKQGSLLVSARKDGYDTLAVDCGEVMIWSTGTHFSVDRDDNRKVTVSVLEGSVLVEDRAGANSVSISANKFHSFGAHDWTVNQPQVLEVNKLELLKTRFADMGAGWMKHRMENHQLYRSSDSVHQKQLLKEDVRTLATPDLTLRRAPKAQNQLEIAKRMIERKDYSHAAHVLVLFRDNYPEFMQDSIYMLTAECFHKAAHTEKAVSSYNLAARFCTSDTLVQLALHRRNMLLFSKSEDRAVAQKALSDYLLLYPESKWRELQMHALILLSARRDRLLADKLINQFVEEFPESCRKEELFSIRDSWKAD